MTGKTISHYKILEKLGQGGMGVVYRAEDTKLNRSVALKFLLTHGLTSQQEKARFQYEAQSAAALDHPSICTVYEIDEAEGQMFIAMAYIEGQSLQDIVGASLVGAPGRASTRPAPTLIEILNYATQIAEGLQAAHEKNIVHRDIKPANLLVTEKGQIKITDFGLAKLAGRTQLTKEGTSMGTVAYMSPEQAQGIEVDHRTDIWALGAVIYEMLTGQQPFAGDYEQAVMYSIMNEDPEPPTSLRSNVPMALEQIVLKAMAKEPGERYQHVDEMLVDLKRVAREVESGKSKTRTTSAGATSRWSQQARTWFVAAPILVLLLLAGWFFLQTDFKPTDAPVSKAAIAVLPFSIRGGEEIAYLREGMVDLLSAKLDGAGDLRSVDPHALLGYLAHDATRQIDPSYANDVATHFQAGHFVLGSVVKVGSQLQLSASLYETNAPATSKVGALAKDEAELVSAVDALAHRLIAGQLSAHQQQTASLAVLTTASVPAMKAYLKGEGHMRRAEWDQALTSFQQAVSEDSVFALAWYKLSNAASWSQPKELIQPARDRALALSDQLPERVRKLMRARNADQIQQAERLFREVLAAYPYDVEALIALGDLLYHSNYSFGRPTAESREYFERALLYDRSNSEPLLHLTGIAAVERRFADLDSLMSRLGRLGKTPVWVEVLPALSKGSEGGRQALINQFANREIVDRVWAAGAAVTKFGDAATASDILNTLIESSTPQFKFFGRVRDTQQFARINLSWTNVIQGRLRASAEELAHLDSSFDGTVLVNKILSQTRPFIPPNPDRLRELKQQLAEWDTLSAPLVTDSKSPAHPGEQFEIKVYLNGLLNFGLRENDDFAQNVLELRGRAQARGETSLAYSFYATLRALQLWQEEMLEEAPVLLNTVPFELTYRQGHRTEFASQSFIRYLRAELHFALGQNKEALRWYRSLHDVEGTRSESLYLGGCYRREAKIYERLGEIDKAVERLDRFIDLWQDCDPELRPMVEEARQDRERFLREKIKEPEGRSKEMRSGAGV